MAKLVGMKNETQKKDGMALSSQLTIDMTCKMNLVMLHVYVRNHLLTLRDDLSMKAPYAATTDKLAF